METNSTAPIHTTTKAPGLGQAARALTTALCAAVFVVLLAFGGPNDQASRWDSDVDAHSEIGYEVALDTTVLSGE